MKVLVFDRPRRPTEDGRAPAFPVVRRFLARPSRRLATFAGLVLALEAATVLARLGRDVTPFVLVMIPPVAALLVSAAGGGTAAVKSLFARMGRWRVRWQWYLAAVGIPVIEKLLVDLAGIVAGATTPGRLVGALPMSALIVPLVVLVPALLEEFGWRGFGVQTLADAGRSPARAAAVVGVLFVLLHVPLYLPGHIYEGLPLWPSPIILLAGAVLLTWIYLRTGSALLAGLMHASLNASVPLTWGLDPAWVWQARAAVLASIAIVLVLVTGRWWLMAGSGTNVRHEDRPGTGATPAVSEPPGPPPPRRRRNAVLTWTRRVVSIVLGLLFVLVSAGAGYESIMYAGDATRYPPAGRQIDVGGHHMHLHCLGAGSPTVIMEGGGGGNVLHWMTVQPDIALSTRVCVYDRAGMGWSEPGPLPRTPERIVAELHGLLVTARVPSPYVLVGHSIGGKYVRLYAARYPLDVAGMVLVDPRHESADAAMSPARRAEDQDGALAQQRRTRVRG